jgi:hypothetical protein
MSVCGRRLNHSGPEAVFKGTETARAMELSLITSFAAFPGASNCHFSLTSLAGSIFRSRHTADFFLRAPRENSARPM